MKLVTRAVTPDCEWVLGGQGVPTRKRDGTNVRVCLDLPGLRGISLPSPLVVEKRRNPTREEKAAGAEPGYMLARPDDPADQHIFAAVKATDFSDWPEGWHPCEALGPKIQGGVEGCPPRLYPFLLRPEVLDFPPPWTFDTIRGFLAANVMEGIVWHHPGGKFAKIKRRDLALPWPLRPTP